MCSYCRYVQVCHYVQVLWVFVGICRYCSDCPTQYLVILTYTYRQCHTYTQLQILYVTIVQVFFCNTYKYCTHFYNTRTYLLGGSLMAGLKTFQAAPQRSYLVCTKFDRYFHHCTNKVYTQFTQHLFFQVCTEFAHSLHACPIMCKPRANSVFERPDPCQT